MMQHVATVRDLLSRPTLSQMSGAARANAAVKLTIAAAESDLRLKQWFGAKEVLVTLVFLPSDEELAATQGAYDPELVTIDRDLAYASRMVFAPYWYRVFKGQPGLPLIWSLSQVITNLFWWYSGSAIQQRD